MSDFTKFRAAIQKQFDKLASKSNLYQAHVEKDVLWDTYLESFPQGSNPLFRERAEHDCVCCKRFIRNIGRVVGEVDGNIETVFDINVGGAYQVVADSMAGLVRDKSIAGIYLNDEQRVGQPESYETLDDGSVHTWQHFSQVLPTTAFSLNGDIASRKGKAQTNCKVLKRSITELSPSSVAIVEDLILQNSIYRGTEMLPIVKGLANLQKGYEEATNKDLFLWNKTLEMQANNHDCNMRGTAIGTLLVDLTSGTELEAAVKKYEDKVSGTNYKRTTALVTPKMKEQAKATAKELQIEPSLLRRYATKEDISVNDVLFADSTVQPFMEDSLFDSVPTKSNQVKNLDKVEEVSVDQFINNILPKVESIEVYLENKHESNLMSMVAPVNAQAPCIMKWGNNFSWSYNGEVADSVIKQQVKSAGGVVDAPFRISLSWQNRDDLDLHLVEPDGNRVSYMSKRGRTGCQLDVDMQGEQLHQVENIYWEELSRLKGNYYVEVNNYSANHCRSGEESLDGFTVEVEHLGSTVNYSYPKKVRNRETVKVLNFAVGNNGDVVFTDLIPSTGNSFNSKELWNITTGEFHKVDMIMNSPNHWEGAAKTGNKHLFFVLNNCKNPDSTRGFYNEYLINELNPHRKVFEILASQLKAEYSEDQLSGLGFSSTLTNEVTLRVKGSFNRVIKVKF